MDEYFKRVNYANSNFSMNSTDGWASDMGMIHILFGSPDDISRSSDLQRGVSYVTWYYYSIGKNFRFIDEFGFRDYRLIEPFF
jgi:GWxTD domain-containing protein